MSSPENYFFFFSYAREDEENRTHIDKFFKDLCNEIRLQEGTLAREAPVGFRDKANIGLGSQWPRVLAQALCRAKTLVCLYSPCYFNRPYCGKEFQVFLDRHKQHGPIGTATAILPVVWMKTDGVPKPISNIQYDHAGLPRDYLDNGLRDLMRLRRYKPYQEFVGKFAAMVLKAAEIRLKELEQDIDFEKVANAFEGPNPHSGVEPAFGPESVCFVYVASTRSEIETNRIRQTLGAYGLCRHEWNPYFNSRRGDSIWRTSFEVAMAGNLYPHGRDIGSDLNNDLRKAKERNSLVVLLIDTWTLKLPEIARIMQSYDASSFLNCAALVIWDESDETEDERAALETMLNKIFEDNYARNYPRFFRPEIISRDVLLRELAETLQFLKFNMINRGRPQRVAAGPKESMPSL